MKLKSHLGALAVLLISAQIALCQNPDGAPKIVIAKTEHNFGEVKKGEVASYSFVFQNEGPAELLIKNVTPSCGCTASEFTKAVARGQQGKITLSINTANFTGAVTKSAEVTTNDPQRERFTLALNLVITSDEEPQGRQIGPFIVGPSNQSILRSAQGIPANGLITINNIAAQPIRITRVDPNGDAFSVNLNTLSEGKRYSLSFVSSTNLPVGSHKQTVKLATDSKEKPELEINLEAIVINAVSVNPQSLVFESVPVSDPEADISVLSKLLWVRLERGAGVEIKSISSDLSFVKVKRDATYGQSQMVVLRVGFSEKPSKGTHKGRIRIETNDPNTKVIEIPITVNAH
jgi:hypothetical protein